MAKRCPPGVFCVETFSLLLILVCVGFIAYVVTRDKPANVGTNNLLMPTQAPVRHAMVINTPTQRTNNVFSQVGLLTNSKTGENRILPLMGRMLLPNRNTWQYYALSDQNNAIRLPVSLNGKSCMDEYGCNELTNGDTVYLEGYNDTFTVTLYDRNTFTYNSLL